MASLNAYQVSGVAQPFTCPVDHGCGSIRLIAGKDGWRCAVECCGYRQDWAYRRMASWRWQLPTGTVSNVFEGQLQAADTYARWVDPDRISEDDL